MHDRDGWGLGRFLMVWGALTGVQAATLRAVWDTPMLTVGVVAVMLVQIVKIWPARERLAGLARPPDDAIYGVVPLLNVALFFWLLGGAPQGQQRQRRLRTWEGQESAIDAWGEALGTAAATAPTVLLPTIALGLAHAGVVEGAAALMEQVTPPAGQDATALTQGLQAVLVVLGLYGLLQFAKRATASRASWLPMLAFVPTLLWFFMVLGRGSTSQVGAILSGLPAMAAEFLFGPPFLAVLVALWVGAARPTEGGPWAMVRARWADLTAVIGGRTLAAQLGFQLMFIPGVWFSVSYALSDVLALLQPAEPAFQGSMRRVKGARSRVFKVLVIWFMATVTLQIGSWLPFVAPTEIMSAMMGAHAVVPPWMYIMAGFLGVFPTWLCTLAMLAMYDDRERVLAERARAAMAPPAMPVPSTLPSPNLPLRD